MREIICLHGKCMEDMSTGDKINICRRPEFSENMTEQAPNKTNPAKKYVACEFFLPQGWRLNICRTRLQYLPIRQTKNGPVMKDSVLVTFYIVNQKFSQNLLTGPAKILPLSGLLLTDTLLMFCKSVARVGGRVRVTVRG
jgi:hypothetical protein